MNNLIPFQSEQFGEVRVVMRDGEPWWVASDVCRVLEIGNPSDVIRALDDDEKITLDNIEGNPRFGIPHQLNIISESGLYSLIFRSRKPEAKTFRRWVTSEVLPSIRKHGGYLTPALEEELCNKVLDRITARSIGRLIDRLVNRSDKLEARFNKSDARQLELEVRQAEFAERLAGRLAKRESERLDQLEARQAKIEETQKILMTSTIQYEPPITQEALRAKILALAAKKGHVSVQDIHNNIKNCSSIMVKKTLESLVDSGELLTGFKRGARGQSIEIWIAASSITRRVKLVDR
jgi:prophage antirepressor-like protein